MKDREQNAGLAVGRALSEEVNPGLEKALAERYDPWLPGFSEWRVSTVYGGIYAREGLSRRERQIATIAALTVLGGQMRGQLKVHIKGALAIGMAPKEICEVILQMVLYGGFPAMINALNAALDVFTVAGIEP